MAASMRDPGTLTMANRWRAHLRVVFTRRRSVRKDPLEGVKRRTYLIATLCGLPALVLVWISMGTEGFVANMIFSLFMLFYLACVLALWSRVVSIRLAERAMFLGVVAFVFAHLSYVLYTYGSLDEARTTITEVSYTTLTALYVVAYLIFDSRTALRISLTFFGLQLFAVLLKALSEAPGGPNLGEILWLLRMHAFMGAVIALIYASSYVKDQLLLQREMAEAMHRLAHTDQLTGVANRRELYSELKKETDKSERYGRPLSIIFFDLDHFKSVNDTYGHDCGDGVLREVVRATQRVLRATDRLGRWGGEEFVVLAPETDLRQASRLAERLRVEIANHRHGTGAAVTASLGFAEYEATRDTAETLLKRADQALYKAKFLGRNRAEPADWGPEGPILAPLRTRP
ncbi:MAG: GGDEF domain-containing protein [Actinomycetota bacterium]|nr:GGDEF domain-containing protein [Actinomycetota bacterium]